MWSLANKSFIYGAVRTPIGKLNGSLARVPAPDLASAAIKEAVRRSQVPSEKITCLILGNVLSAGLGQAPARQAAINAGLPTSVDCMTVNKVCGSGLKAVMLADDLVRLNEGQFIVAGGMENMSLSPLLTPRGKGGASSIKSPQLDSMVHDGLLDSFGGCHMGEIAESIAEKGRYSREDQDGYAMESYRRARKAQEQGLFSEEIVPVWTLEGGRQVLAEKDEQPCAHDLANIPKLHPGFRKEGGTVTPGNASALNDGAAALVIGPRHSPLVPMARIVGHASHSMEPDQFPLAPVEAIYKLLDMWKTSLDDIDLFEINEAFAVTSLAVVDRLGIPLEKVNVHGGAVALGHPIGASGARILVTLLHALARKNLRKGIAAICIGGGEAVALGVDMKRF